MSCHVASLVNRAVSYFVHCRTRTGQKTYILAVKSAMQSVKASSCLHNKFQGLLRCGRGPPASASALTRLYHTVNEPSSMAPWLGSLNLHKHNIGHAAQRTAGLSEHHVKGFLPGLAYCSHGYLCTWEGTESQSASAQRSNTMIRKDRNQELGPKAPRTALNQTDYNES
jgi:hypothetical protein